MASISLRCMDCHVSFQIGTGGQHADQIVGLSFATHHRCKFLHSAMHADLDRGLRHSQSSAAASSTDNPSSLV
jgi:hypothetical protein